MDTYAIHGKTGVHTGQKRSWDSLGLELKAIVSHPIWVLERELGHLEEHWVLGTAHPALWSSLLLLLLFLLELLSQ